MRDKGKGSIMQLHPKEKGCEFVSKRVREEFDFSVIEMQTTTKMLININLYLGVGLHLQCCGPRCISISKYITSQSIF